MAAVLCLIGLPIVCGVLFMFGAIAGEPTFGGVFAGLTFLLLGAGIVVGALNMSKGWEADPLDKPHA